jgi:ABC transporter substrate binding protein
VGRAVCEAAGGKLVGGWFLIVGKRSGDTIALLVRDLLLANPDAIIAIGPDAIRTAAEATKTVPIVTFGADPVQLGFAATLARPGRNVTGIAILAEELDGKRMDLLHEAVPAASRIAALLLPLLSYRVAIERQIGVVAAKSRCTSRDTGDLDLSANAAPPSRPNAATRSTARGSVGSLPCAPAVTTSPAMRRTPPPFRPQPLI